MCVRLWNIRACCLQREFIGLSGPRLSGLTCNPIVSMLTRSLIGWERVRPTPDWLSSVVGGAGRQLNGSKISSTQCQQARRHRTPELSYFASSQGRETERARNRALWLWWPHHFVFLSSVKHPHLSTAGCWCEVLLWQRIGKSSQCYLHLACPGIRTSDADISDNTHHQMPG